MNFLKIYNLNYIIKNASIYKDAFLYFYVL